MKLNPFTYFTRAINSPLGVGLLEKVDTDDITPIPPISARYRAITQGGLRFLTQGAYRITTEFLGKKHG